LNQHQRPLGESPPAASPNHPGKWRWNWQLLAQGAWIVLAFLLLITFVANIPAFFQSSRTGCTLPNPTQCPTGLFTPGNVQALDQLHFSVTVAADFLATLTLAVSVFYTGFLVS
jgi:hypothetical protein